MQHLHKIPAIMPQSRYPDTKFHHKSSFDYKMRDPDNGTTYTINPLPQMGLPQTEPPKPRLTKEQEHEIVTLYTGGHPTLKILHQFNIAPNTMMRVIDLHGAPRRRERRKK